jgi:hypothetical protein
MRTFLIHIARALALAVIGTAFLADMSMAEKQSADKVKQTCNLAGGTFVLEQNGKYSCIYDNPSWNRDNGTTIKNCTADGDCSFSFCTKGRCTWVPIGDGAKQAGKPGKREGSTTTTMTAGTADQRGGHATHGGLEANATLKGGNGAGAATSAPLSSAPVAGKIGTAKPLTRPDQLSERVNRLQQQR